MGGHGRKRRGGKGRKRKKGKGRGKILVSGFRSPNNENFTSTSSQRQRCETVTNILKLFRKYVKFHEGGKGDVHSGLCVKVSMQYIIFSLTLEVTSDRTSFIMRWLAPCWPA
jgi:hypothetical protein